MIPKFRAWDKRHNEIVSVHEINFKNDTLTTESIDNGISKDVQMLVFILMQSTGLKDKNGVEIFEGDLLYYIPFESHINNSVVVFEKGSFCTKMLRNGKLTSVRFIDSEEYEVIGNVWDNPELLEGN